MPDQHCPVCGTVRTAGGCGCSPDLTETTVLPHIEGPPLVRPYVPQAVGRPEEPAQAAPAPPDYDAFPPAVYATALMPPVPATMPAAPFPSAAFPPAPPASAPYESAPHPAAQHPAAPDELGLFAFDNAPDPEPGQASAAGPGRAARRAGQRNQPARRRGAILAAGAGVVVLGVGAAFLTAPSDSGNHSALPLPSVTAAPTVSTPTDPPSNADPSASTQPTDSASAAPSPARTSRAPVSRATTAAPAPVSVEPAPPVPVAPAVPATTQAAPPAAPSPSAPAATSAPPTAAPSASATPATLRRDAANDPVEVKAMQVKLVAVSCGTVDKSIESGTFDWWTQWVVSNYQKQHKIKSEDGVYGPATRAVLEADKPAC